MLLVLFGVMLDEVGLFLVEMEFWLFGVGLWVEVIDRLCC